MFKILERKELAQDIFQLVVEAPRVARSAKPGQFVIVRADEKGERIPLTISDYDVEQGTVSIVIQAIGVSTRKICAVAHGGTLADFAGPLGKPSDFVHEDLEELRHKKLLFIAGGVGTAPVYPQVKWLNERGIKADVIVGAKTAAMHIMTDEMREVAGKLYLTTDDGTVGFHGLVTDQMKELIDSGNRYDEVIAIGPMIMMKFVALATEQYGIKTTVSLNTLMVDGTGMCGACRVTVGGKTVFTCVDGPEFDGHQVDFDEAIRRQGMYRDIEERARKIAEERAAGHKCNIGLDR
ncbi:MAG: sulfide/dihydroorotate dehydrogenase-like FAD/NAD-binding protein [Alistipes sp.]|nr:sulfide/dihydroorotate dehydrogenase-like FAD/NAD-binding protein [Alistipes sp.]